MKTVVTAEEMARLDRLTMEQYGLSGVLLMENAGRGAAELILRRFAELNDVHIYCGPGNNGGDGFVIARYLLNRGVRCSVFLLAEEDRVRDDARFHLERLQAFGLLPVIVRSAADLPKEKPSLIVDALLGTGSRGELRGVYAEAVDAVNAQGVPVAAVDLPTGVDADTGAVAGRAVKADLTLTMALLKRGLLFSPGRECCGLVEIVDICMPRALIQENPSRVELAEANDIRLLLPQRSPAAHKTQCGRVLVIAGSRGFTGAASLTSLSALRIGAGLSYLAAPADLNAIYESRLTEVITLPTPDSDGFLSEAALPGILPLAENMDAVAVGPGLGRRPETVALVLRLLKSLDKPLVLDADGLNACVGRTDLIAAYRGPLVLTPHAGELARLTGLSSEQISRDPVNIARRFAQEWRCTLVLKGGPTVTASADGRVIINSTGNAGMATAGTGDVLTGVVAGLLAQGLEAADAAVAGVFVHGAAGDRAAERRGQHGLIATDLLDEVPAAVLSLVSGTRS